MELGEERVWNAFPMVWTSNRSLNRGFAAPPLRQDKSIRAVFALSGRLRICLVVAIKPPTAQHGFLHPTREASKTDHTEFS
ncbi:hypothetical protein TNCV_3775981 [Trichonephila clavipes]|nr:hypothetical protein TNCV_3775981 [Trichonephila clavipes]